MNDPETDDDTTLACELLAVAREARRLAAEGGTAEERLIHQARKRAVLQAMDERS
jgi:hypothetical protein